MIDREQMIRAFALNLNVVKRQIDGLTQADSLLQPPFRGNCMNWVLGHITVNQNQIVKLLGEEPVLTDAEHAHYETNSQPVTDDGEDNLRLERLLDALDKS